MKKICAMIVDDSDFSIKLTKEILGKSRIDVVCEATTVKEALEKFQENKNFIDLVTMDITLPDGDGIDCAKKLILQKPDLKVIAISSMMDNEIIKKAKDVGITSFIQKPIDSDELVSKISRIFETDALFDKLNEVYEDAFIESVVSFLSRTTKTVVKYEKLGDDNKAIPSKGISIAIGLIGLHRGRFIFDVSRETALDIANKSKNENLIKENDVSVYIMESSNIMAGNAISLLNGVDRGFGFRVSPPTIFSGEDLEVFIGDMESSSIKFITEFGNIFINVGFQRGKSEWM